MKFKLKPGAMWSGMPKIFLVMKLIAIILFIALTELHASSFAQKISIKERNISVEKILSLIEKKSNYHFVYFSKLDMLKSKKLNVDFNEAPINDILDKCLSDLPVSYTIIQQTIALKENTPVIKNPSEIVQQLRITGIVADENGKPLPGVTIRLKGTTIGVTSNNLGVFTLNVPGNKATLEFSSIGYESQSIDVNGQTEIKVKLKPAYSKLNEIVVVGYGTQSRKLVSSSISQVDGASLANQPVGTPGEALAGLAAGIQVQSDQGAKPGEAPTIRVRGISSLSSSNDPLYVVDGYPLESSANFTLLNPSDIESIEILKDAASASIYGSRAANGVILVTTKRGKVGKTVFALSSHTGVQTVTSLVDVLNRDEFISNMKDIYRINKGAYPSIFNTSPTTLPDVNWQEQIFRNAAISNIEFNASGGSDKIRFNASAGYFKQKGVLIGTEYSRTTVRVNLDADIIKNLKFGFSVSPSYTEQYRQPASGQFSGAGVSDQLIGVPGLLSNYNLPGPLNQALTMPPVVPVYRDNGDFAEAYDPALNYILPPASPFFPTNYFNPLNIITQAINRGRSFKTLSNAFLTYTPIKGLTLKTFIGATLENTLVHAYIPATMASSQSPMASFSNPSLVGIYASDNARNSFGWVWENTATFDKTYGKHHFNLLGLFSAQKYTSQINYTAGLPGTFVTTAVESPLASTNTIGTEGFDANDFVSYAGRLTYDYNKKYLLTAAIRQDGSSKFGPGNRYAVFPSFSLGWRLGEERFLKPILEKVSVNELKLRGGYGKTGNANIGSFTYANSIALNKNYASGSAKIYGAQQVGFANPYLTWEKNTQTNFGVDLGLLNNRVTLTVDYFNRISDGMLLNKALPAIVGYASSYKANLGRLNNKGLEFSANTNFSIGSVKWKVNANLSSYRTKVLDLGGPSALPAVAAIFGWNNAYQVKVGQPLGIMYGYTVLGVFKNATDLSSYPHVPGGNKVGDWIVKDQDGDGKVNANDITEIGHGLPDFTYGLTNTFQYKRFDLSVLIQGVQGVNIINGNLRQLLGGNGNLNTSKRYYQNYFDPAQPDRDVEFPKPANGSSIGTTNALVKNAVENGSYLRVRNITLGYQLNEALIRKISLKTLRVYVTGQNPFLITKYSGYNPEASVNGSDPTTPGVDQGTYPTARTFIVGINVGF
ncbi:TonB-linked outer membrane protein, SusC/RagA family [Pedobacter sp. ok626]|nr:TonB-linked outer membrane protein, SusC/RagA family [Pedobacter sp. ok626]